MSNKNIEGLITKINEVELRVYIKHCTPKKKNTHFSQIHMAHFPHQTINQSIKQLPINLKILKSYQGASPTTMEWSQSSVTEEKLKNLKYVVIKTYTLKQPVSLRTNHKRIIKYSEMNENENVTYQNLQDVPKAELKQKFIAQL